MFLGRYLCVYKQGIINAHLGFITSGYIPNFIHNLKNENLVKQ